MTLSKKTKEQLVAEVKKLQKKIDLLQKRQSVAKAPTSSLKDSRWESFFKNAVNSIIVINKKGEIVDINRLSTEKNVLGKSIYDLVAKDSVKAMKAAVALVFKSQKTQEYKTWTIDGKGNTKYYKSKVIAIVEDKKVIAAVIDATEITNEIVAQQQIKQNEERFKKLSDSAFEGIVIHQHGKIVEVNKAICDMFRYTEKELIGQPILKFIDPGYHELVMGKLKAKDENQYEMLMLKKGKQPFWAELRANELIHNDAPARVAAIRDITKNKEYEIKIRESEERFRMLAQNAVDVVFRYTIFPDYRQEYISPSIQKMTGYSPENFYRDPQLGVKIIHPEDVHLVLSIQKDQKTKKPGMGGYESKPLVLRWIKKDGGVIWTETINKPVFNEKGKMVAIEGISRDITERKIAETELKQSEENLNTILDSINELVYFIEFSPDRKTRIKYLGKNIEELLGVTAKEYATEKEKLASLCHPDDLESIQAVAKKLHKTKTPQQFIYRFLHRGKGEYIWLEEQVTPQLDAKGNYIGNFGITRDVTERKQREEQLKDSEQKFRMLAENASDLIYRYRLYPELKYEYVSPSAKALTGYSPEDFYDQPMLSFKLIHPDDMSLLGNSEQLILEKVKLGSVKEPPLILRWVKKDGSVIWTETRNKPIFDEDKRLVAIEGISRDITLQKQNEDDLRDSEERFKLLSNATFEGIVFTENGIVIDANDQFVDMYGFGSSKEIIGKHLIDDFVVDEQKSLARRFLRLTKSEPFEVQTIRKDGSIISVETKGQNIPYFAKNIRATVIYNITERKQYESNLRESERTLSTLMNNLPGMAYRCENDEKRSMRFVSKGFQDLTGYNPKDIINNKKRSFADIIHPDDRYKGKEAIGNALKTQSTFEIEYRLISASGESKWVLEKGEGVFADDGKLLFLEGFITDVNAKKQYELELTQSRENYKSLVDYSPDGVFIHIDGKVVFANPSALKLAEMQDMEKALSYSLFDFLLPEYHDEVINRIKKASLGHSQNFIEVKIRAVTGEIKEVETKPILIKFNGQTAILTVVHDITTQKKLIKEQTRAQIAEETNELLEQEITERKVAQLRLLESQKYTRLLINSSLDMICASDRDGFITEFNNAALKTFGYKPEEVLGKHVSILYADPDERTRITEHELYSKGSFAGEVLNIKKSGVKFFAYLSASVLRNEEGSVVGAMGVSRDISELKRAEQELRESEEKYRAIYEQAFIGIAKVDLRGQFVQVNEHLCNILGYSKEELCGKKYTDIIVPEDIGIDYHRILLSGEHSKANFEKRYIHKNGDIVNANVTVSTVRNVDGQITHFIAVFQDISESVKADETLKAQSAKFNAIIESSSHVIWTVDRNICLTTFNENYGRQQRQRYNIDIKVGLSMITGDAISTNEYNNFWIKKYESTFAGNPQYFETQFFDKEGTESWGEIYLNPIFGKDGQIMEVSGIGHDITEKKKSEEKIRQSLQEKEVLLKEVHHRVKNNLQVISSILNLQSSYVKDEGTLNILKESQNRIKSMAFIHESLYQTKDFSNINFTEYVINLSQNLIHSYSNFDHEIKLNLDIQNVFLNLDLAIPCGLIINEIVSNALKYAFVDDHQGGEITISMKIEGENLVLIIGDNGVGLPKHIDYRNTESLGLQLVVTLTDQLSGKIHLNLEKGTNYTIIFKQNQVKNRI
ncbi:MAG TPA: PAS domain S-box protein [Bacteroidia bacterium]|jgi:PAS domain S-box-containing protein